MTYPFAFCYFCSFSLIPSTHLRGGFALLPFLCFVNVVWFFKEAFIRASFTGQSKLKPYRAENFFFQSQVCYSNLILLDESDKSSYWLLCNDLGISSENFKLHLNKIACLMIFFILFLSHNSVLILPGGN